MSSRLARWGRVGAFFGALGLAAAVAPGCSGSSNTQGEIVVAVQTDLSLPKDVSQVRIQISTLGVIRFDNTYPVGPDPSMRIPATIGLLPGENPNAPIRIRIVGFKKEFQPRILREVVTTVPPSRVVSLRMPLQWLSDGSAVANPPGTGGSTPAGFGKAMDSTDPFAFYNRCPDGQTDVGGDCVSSTIDSSTLPDYSPADIFGGGDQTGAGGTCFDTQPCMLSGIIATAVVAPDGSCDIAAPQGDPALVNVALEFGANGDGICADSNGAGPCFVPLDKVDSSTPNLGWTPGTEAPPAGTGGSGGGPVGADGGSSGTDGSAPMADAGPKRFPGIHTQDVPVGGDAGAQVAPFATIHLPPAVCRKVTAPGFAGQIVVSNSCTSKTPKNPTCGPWSSVSSNSSEPVADSGPIQSHDGSAGEGGTNCSPQCGGSTGACGCSETCNGHSYSVTCSTAGTTSCSCVVDGTTVFSGPAAGVSCADSTGKSLQTALADCIGGTHADGGLDAGLDSGVMLSIVPSNVQMAPIANQHFDVFYNAQPVAATAVTWTVDPALLTAGATFNAATGDYHAGDVVSVTGHILAQYNNLKAAAIVTVGSPPTDGGTDAGPVDAAPPDAAPPVDSGTDAGINCPAPSCGVNPGDAGNTCSCTAMCSDSVTYTMSCNGSTCSCSPQANSFPQSTVCSSPAMAGQAWTACHP